MQGPDAVTASGPFFLDYDCYNQKKSYLCSRI